ncbi:MAG TPA: (2Fe-2S)-binding protein [Tepidisphaeraceae bacterium]
MDPITSNDDPVVIETTINKKPQRLSVEPGRPLLEVLREDLALTGTRYGCGDGTCGACGVLVDGRRVLSCVMPASDVAGKSVTTIEGLADGDTLHPVQRVFLDEGAFQCGYCTAGMVIGVIGCVNESPAIAGAALIEKMNNNICRCCGYVRISGAIQRAAEAMRREAK